MVCKRSVARRIDVHPLRPGLAGSLECVKTFLHIAFAHPQRGSAPWVRPKPCSLQILHQCEIIKSGLSGLSGKIDRSSMSAAYVVYTSQFYCSQFSYCRRSVVSVKACKHELQQNWAQIFLGSTATLSRCCNVLAVDYRVCGTVSGSNKLKNFCPVRLATTGGCKVCPLFSICLQLPTDETTMWYIRSSLQRSVKRIWIIFVGKPRSRPSRVNLHIHDRTTDSFAGTIISSIVKHIHGRPHGWTVLEPGGPCGLPRHIWRTVGDSARMHWKKVVKIQISGLARACKNLFSIDKRALSNFWCQGCSLNLMQGLARVCLASTSVCFPNSDARDAV